MNESISNKEKRKIILITGASSGIGLDCSEQFAKAGHIVYGTFRKLPDKNKKLNFTPIYMDVTKPQSITECIETIMKKEGRIDVLVNNAGILAMGSIEEMDISLAEKIMNTNFFGMARVTKVVLPIMRKQRSGRIINMSSAAGLIPWPYGGYYCASKHAVEGYTKALAAEIRKLGIWMILIEPGFIKTKLDANAEIANHINDYQAIDAALKEYILMKFKNAEPADLVAKIVLKAALVPHPKSHYIIGREAKLLCFLNRIIPNTFSRIFRLKFGI